MTKEFTIDRSKWLNGELYDREYAADKSISEGLLRDGKGFKCCLGFYSEACGAKIHRVGIGLPSGLNGPEQEKLHSSVLNNEDTFAETNDDDTLNPIVRESKIRNMFGKLGIKVTFVGKYPVF